MTSKGRTGRKNGHHEGHVSAWRGRYRGSVMVQGKRYWSYGPTRGEVVKKLDAIKLRLRRGEDVRSGGVTLQKYAKEWLDFGSHRWAASTFSNYESAFRLYLTPQLGSRRVDSLTPQHVQACYSQLIAVGLRADGVHKCHKALRACLAQAVKQRVISFNPCIAVDVSKPPEKEKPRLTDAQVRSLAVAAESDRLGSLFLLLMGTGLRISEALGLTWKDVDFSGQVIHVNKQLQSLNGNWLLSKLKTKGSRRVVEIGDSVLNSLRGHKLQQTTEQLRLGSEWRNDLDLVFVGEFGQPLDRHNVLRRNWKNVLAQSDLGLKLGLHDLRHVFATTALSKGMPITTVSSMLGHKDASTTLRVYAASVPQSGRVVADAMDAVLTVAI